MNEIPADLSGLSYESLSALFNRTGSKRVAAELRRFAPPVTSDAPIAPVVAPRPPMATYLKFSPSRRPAKERRYDKRSEGKRPKAQD